MKDFPRLLACFVIAATAAHGQLVHLQFSGPLFPGGSGPSAWSDGLLGSRFTLDLYYDARTAGIPAGAPWSAGTLRYAFADPTVSYWRFRAGELDYSASFTQGLVMRERSLFFAYLTPQIYTDFSFPFESGFVHGLGGLPIPPLPAFDTAALNPILDVFETGPDFALGEGMVFGYTDTLLAEIVPALSPTPEPSAYTAGAVFVVVSSILWRRFRSRLAKAASP